MQAGLNEIRYLLVNQTSPAKVDLIRSLRQVSWLEISFNAFPPFIGSGNMLNDFTSLTVAGQHRIFTGFPFKSFQTPQTLLRTTIKDRKNFFMMKLELNST